MSSSEDSSLNLRGELQFVNRWIEDLAHASRSHDDISSHLRRAMPWVRESIRVLRPITVCLWKDQEPVVSKFAQAQVAGSEYPHKCIEDEFPAVELHSDAFKSRIRSIKRLLSADGELQHLHKFLSHSTTTIPGYITTSTGCSQISFRIVSTFLQHLLQLSIPLFFLDLANPAFIVNILLGLTPVQFVHQVRKADSAPLPVYSRPPGSDFKLYNSAVLSPSASYGKTVTFAPNALNIYGFTHRPPQAKPGREANTSNSPIASPTASLSSNSNGATEEIGSGKNAFRPALENSDLLDEMTKSYALGIVPARDRKMSISKEALTKLRSLLPKWSFLWAEHSAVVAEAATSISIVNTPQKEDQAPSEDSLELQSLESSPRETKILTLSDLGEIYDDVCDLRGKESVKSPNESKDGSAIQSPNSKEEDIILARLLLEDLELRSAGIVVDDLIMKRAYISASGVSSGATAILESVWSNVGGITASKLDDPPPFSHWEDHIRGISSAERERIRSHPTITTSSYHHLRCLTSYLRLQGPELFCAKLRLSREIGNNPPLSEMVHQLIDYVSGLSQSLRIVAPDRRLSIAKALLEEIPSFYIASGKYIPYGASSNAFPAPQQPSLQNQKHLQNALDTFALKSGIKEPAARLLRDEFDLRASFRALEAPSEQGALRISGAVRLADLLDRAMASRILRQTNRPSNWVMSVLQIMRDRNGDVSLNRVGHERALSLSLSSVVRIIRRRELVQILTAPNNSHAETIKRAKSALRVLLLSNLLELSDLASLWRVVMRCGRQVAHETVRYAVYEVVLDLLTLLYTHVRNPFEWVSEKETLSLLESQADLRSSRIRSYRSYESSQSNEMSANAKIVQYSFPELFAEAEKEIGEATTRTATAAATSGNASSTSSYFFSFGSSDHNGIASDSELVTLESKLASDADYLTLFDHVTTSRQFNGIRLAKDIMLYELSTSPTSSGLGGDSLADWSFFDPITGDYFLSSASQSGLDSNVAVGQPSNMRLTSNAICSKYAGIFRDFFDLCISRSPLECIDEKFISFVESYNNRIYQAFDGKVMMPPPPKPRFRPILQVYSDGKSDKSSVSDDTLPTTTGATAGSGHELTSPISTVSGVASAPSTSASDPVSRTHSTQVRLAGDKVLLTNGQEECEGKEQSESWRLEDIDYDYADLPLSLASYVGSSPKVSTLAMVRYGVSEDGCGPKDILNLINEPLALLPSSQLFNHYYELCGVSELQRKDTRAHIPVGNVSPGFMSAVSFLWCLLSTLSSEMIPEDQAISTIEGLRGRGVARTPLPLLISTRISLGKFTNSNSFDGADESSSVQLLQKIRCTLVKLLAADSREPLRRVVAIDCTHLIKNLSQCIEKPKYDQRSTLIDFLRDIYILYPIAGDDFHETKKNSQDEASNQRTVWLMQATAPQKRRPISRGAFATYLETNVALTSTILTLLSKVQTDPSPNISATQELQAGIARSECLLKLLIIHISAGVSRAREMLKSGNLATIENSSKPNASSMSTYDGVSESDMSSSPILTSLRAKNEQKSDLNGNLEQGGHEIDAVERGIRAIRLRASGLNDVPAKMDGKMKGIPCLTYETFNELWNIFMNSSGVNKNVLSRQVWFIKWLSSQISTRESKPSKGRVILSLFSNILQNQLVHFLLEKVTTLPIAFYEDCPELFELFQKCFVLVHISFGNIRYEGSTMKTMRFGTKADNRSMIDFTCIHVVNFSMTLKSPLQELVYLWQLYLNLTAKSCGPLINEIGDMLLAIHLSVSNADGQRKAISGAIESVEDQSSSQQLLVSICLKLINSGQSAVSHSRDNLDVIPVSSSLPNEEKLLRAATLLRRFVARIGSSNAPLAQQSANDYLQMLSTNSTAIAEDVISELALKSFDVPIEFDLELDSLVGMINASTAVAALTMSTLNMDSKHGFQDANERHEEDPESKSDKSNDFSDVLKERDEVFGHLLEDVERALSSFYSSTLPQTSLSAHFQTNQVCEQDRGFSLKFPYDTNCNFPKSVSNALALFLLLKAMLKGLLLTADARKAIEVALTKLQCFMEDRASFHDGNGLGIPTEIERSCKQVVSSIKDCVLFVSKAMLSPWTTTTKDPLSLKILAGETGLSTLKGESLNFWSAADSSNHEKKQQGQMVSVNVSAVSCAENYDKHTNELCKTLSKQDSFGASNPKASTLGLFYHAAFPSSPGYIIPFVRLLSSLFIAPRSADDLISSPATMSSPYSPARFTRVVFDFDTAYGLPSLPLYLPRGVSDTLVTAALAIYLKLGKDDILRIRGLPCVESASQIHGSTSMNAKNIAEENVSNARKRARDRYFGGAEDKRGYAPVDIAPAICATLLRDAALQADILWLFEKHAKTLQDWQDQVDVQSDITGKDFHEQDLKLQTNVMKEIDFATGLVNSSDAMLLSNATLTSFQVSGLGRQADVDYGSSLAPMSVWSELSGLTRQLGSNSFAKIPYIPMDSFKGSCVFDLSKIHASAPFIEEMKKRASYDNAKAKGLSVVSSIPAPKSIPFLSIQIPGTRFVILDSPYTAQASEGLSVLCIETMRESELAIEGIAHASSVVACTVNKHVPTGIAADMSPSARSAALAIGETLKSVTISEALTYGLLKPGMVLPVPYQASVDSGSVCGVGSLAMSNSGGSTSTQNFSNSCPPPSWSPEIPDVLSSVRGPISAGLGKRTEISHLQDDSQLFYSQGLKCETAGSGKIYNASPTQSSTGTSFSDSKRATASLEAIKANFGGNIGSYNFGLQTYVGCGKLSIGSALSSSAISTSTPLAAAIPCTLPEVKSMLDLSQVQSIDRQNDPSQARDVLAKTKSIFENNVQPSSYFSMAHPYYPNVHKPHASKHVDESSIFKEEFASAWNLMRLQSSAYETREGATAVFGIPSLLSPRMLAESSIGYLLPRVRQFIHTANTNLPSGSANSTSFIRPSMVRKSILDKLGEESGISNLKATSEELSSTLSNIRQTLLKTSGKKTDPNAAKLNIPSLLIEDSIRSSLTPQLSPTLIYDSASSASSTTSNNAAQAALSAMGSNYSSLISALQNIDPSEPAAGELLSFVNAIIPDSKTILQIVSATKDVIQHLVSANDASSDITNSLALTAWAEFGSLSSKSSLVLTANLTLLKNLAQGSIVPSVQPIGFVDLDLKLMRDSDVPVLAITDMFRSYAKDELKEASVDDRSISTELSRDSRYPAEPSKYAFTSPSIVSDVCLNTVPHPLVLLAHPSVSFGDSLVMSRIHVVLISKLKIKGSHVDDFAPCADDTHIYSYYDRNIHGTRMLHLTQLCNLFGLLYHLFEMGALLFASRHSSRTTERAIGAYVEFCQYFQDGNQSNFPYLQYPNKRASDDSSKERMDFPGLTNEHILKLARFIIDALQDAFEAPCTDDPKGSDMKHDTLSRNILSSFIDESLKLLGWCIQSDSEGTILKGLFALDSQGFLKKMITKSMLEPGSTNGSSSLHPYASQLRRGAAHVWLAILTPSPLNCPDTLNCIDTLQDHSARMKQLDEYVGHRVQFLNLIADILDPLNVTATSECKDFQATVRSNWNWSASTELSLLVAELLPFLRDRLLLSYLRVALNQKKSLFSEMINRAQEDLQSKIDADGRIISGVHSSILRLNALALGRLLCTDENYSCLSELPSAFGAKTQLSKWQVFPIPLTQQDRASAIQSHLYILHATWAITHSIQNCSFNLGTQTDLLKVIQLAESLTSRVLHPHALSAAIDAIFVRGLSAISVEPKFASYASNRTLSSYFDSIVLKASNQIDDEKETKSFEESKVCLEPEECVSSENGKIEVHKSKAITIAKKVSIGKLITLREANQSLLVHTMRSRREKLLEVKQSDLNMQTDDQSQINLCLCPEVPRLDYFKEIQAIIQGDVDDVSLKNMAPVLSNLPKMSQDAYDICVDSRGAGYRSRFVRIAALAALQKAVLYMGIDGQKLLIDRLHAIPGPLSHAYKRSYHSKALALVSPVSHPLSVLARPPRVNSGWLGALYGKQPAGDVSVSILKSFKVILNNEEKEQTSKMLNSIISNEVPSMAGLGTLGLGSNISVMHDQGKHISNQAIVSESGYGPESNAWLSTNDQLIPDSSRELWSSPNDGGSRCRLATGIYNLGATCYMNSTFQALCSAPLFRLIIGSLNPFLSVPASESGLPLNELSQASSETISSSHFLYELQRAVLSLIARDKGSVHLRRLIPFFKDEEGGPLNVHQHKDAQEFVSSLLNTIVDAVTALSKLQDSNTEKIKGLSPGEVVARSFAGEVSHQIVSQECSHASERPERFFTLTAVVKNKSSLAESLKSMVEGEMLDGDNKYFCSECQKKVVAIRRDCLASLPPCLFIHLKRFEFNYSTMTNSDKLNDYFEFPPVIDLYPYSANALSSATPKDAPDDPAMGSTDSSPQSRERFLYRASAIVVHTGRAEGGHYYAFVRGDNLPGPVQDLKGLRQESVLSRAKGKFKELLDQGVPPGAVPENVMARLYALSSNACRLDVADELGMLANADQSSDGIPNLEEKWSGYENWIELNDQSVSFVHGCEIPDLTFGGTHLVTHTGRNGQSVTTEEVKSYSAYLILYESFQVGVDQPIDSPTYTDFSYDTKSAISSELSVLKKADIKKTNVLNFDDCGFGMGGLLESAYASSTQRSLWLSHADPAMRMLLFNLWSSRSHDYHTLRRQSHVFTLMGSGLQVPKSPTLSTMKEISMLSSTMKGTSAVFSAALEYCTRTLAHSAQPQSLLSWRALLKHLLFPLSWTDVRNLLRGENSQYSLKVKEMELPQSPPMAMISNSEVRLMYLLSECVSLSPLGRSQNRLNSIDQNENEVEMPLASKQNTVCSIASAWETGFDARENFLRSLVEGIDIRCAEPHFAFASTLRPLLITQGNVKDDPEASDMRPSMLQLLRNQVTYHSAEFGERSKLHVDPLVKSGSNGFNCLPPLAQELWLRSSKPLQTMWLELSLFAFRIHVLHKDLRRYVHPNLENSALRQLHIPVDVLVGYAEGKTEDLTSLAAPATLPAPSLFLSSLVAVIPSLRYVAALPPPIHSPPKNSRSLKKTPALTKASPSFTDQETLLLNSFGISNAEDLYSAKLQPNTSHYPDGAAMVDSLFGFLLQLSKTGTNELAYLVSLGLCTSLIRFYCDTKPDIPGFNCAHGTGYSDLVNYRIGKASSASILPHETVTDNEQVASLSPSPPNSPPSSNGTGNSESNASTATTCKAVPISPPTMPTLFALLERLVLATETRSQLSKMQFDPRTMKARWFRAALQQEQKESTVTSSAEQWNWQKARITNGITQFVNYNVDEIGADIAIKLAANVDPSTKSVGVNAVHRLLPCYSAPVLPIPLFIMNQETKGNGVNEAKTDFCEGSLVVRGVAACGDVETVRSLLEATDEGLSKDITVPIDSDINVIFGSSVQNPIQLQCSLELQRDSENVNWPKSSKSVWDLLEQQHHPNDANTYAETNCAGMTLFEALRTVLRVPRDNNYISTAPLLERVLTGTNANFASLYLPHLTKIFSHHLRFDHELQIYVCRTAVDAIEKSMTLLPENELSSPSMSSVSALTLSLQSRPSPELWSLFLSELIVEIGPMHVRRDLPGLVCDKLVHKLHSLIVDYKAVKQNKEKGQSYHPLKDDADVVKPITFITKFLLRLAAAHESAYAFVNQPLTKRMVSEWGLLLKDELDSQEELRRRRNNNRHGRY